MAENGKITPKQSLAIAALMSAKNIGAAAAAAGVGERTLHTWLGDENFRLALSAAEGEAIDRATRRLVALSEAAVAVIGSIMADGNGSSSTQLRAATAVLDHLLKLRELRDIEARLLALEQHRED